MRMPNAARKRVRSLTGVAIGGPWAARLHGANLVLPDGEPDELYLAPAAFVALRGMKGIGWQSTSPDVSLRVVPHGLPDALVSRIVGEVAVSSGAAAADLLDLGDDRSRHAAAELLGRND
ncbi:hypothetical protein [Saccharothrix sp. HUAS TT1]|uniref:hypothetical protein n=1 Tax=unclassified Saccharothrix TaxID=2593673 RepID=UPI00345B4D0F